MARPTAGHPEFLRARETLQSIERTRREALAYAASQGDDEWYALGWASHVFFEAALKAGGSGDAAAARKRLLAQASFELAVHDLEVLSALRARDLDVAENCGWHSKTLASYRRLADTARSRGIVYLAMQYPTGRTVALKNLFSAAPDVSYADFESSLDGHFPGQELLPRYRDIIFVGNESFDRLVAAGSYDEYFSDRFTADHGGRFGHATAKGNSVIAHDAAAAIIENWAAISSRASHPSNFPIIAR